MHMLTVPFKQPDNKFFLLWKVLFFKSLFLKKLKKKNNRNSGFYITHFSHLLWDLLAYNKQGDDN